MPQNKTNYNNKIIQKLMRTIFRPYTNWRTLILAVLGTVAVLLMCAETSTETSLLVDIALKAAGLAIACAVCSLGKYWYRKGQLKELAGLVEED